MFAENPIKINILELYSGIGGFHYAIKSIHWIRKLISSKQYHLTAIDINPSANEIYRLNHLKQSDKSIQLQQRNIQSLNSNEIDRMDLDLLTMSPPCQPFSRLGKRKDLDDFRVDSLRNVMSSLSRAKRKPKYIMLENVKGFECSRAHQLVLSTLIECQYDCKEFLLSPSQFAIPNSRLRYYLLAKYSPELKARNESTIETRVPIIQNGSIFDSNNNVIYKEKIFIDFDTMQIDSDRRPFRKLTNYIENSIDSEENFKIRPDHLLRYRMIIDIVEIDSETTNCFTKSYGHRLEGCGSILKTSNQFTIEEIYDRIAKEENDEIILALLNQLQMRYFTPKEVARLMHFPDELGNIFVNA
ncbi:DNA (cytosine-5)-methyltransferase-like protein 2 [Sarcoptes scabiei]|uniref:Cytosine-specific methyltransferase n=1 Tax=Sarcoptes scabiei TaxID=52283 RepID=A0A132AC86_SARSC|nr:DNA (cytosine-5)-methyltransferase-like protein 2 [Sarcoptes scabiei]